jgi:ATP-dependent Clp protease ATP-binding subunit ClpC
MFERFTDRARRAVALAQEEAKSYRHNYIGTEHVLLGVIDVNEGTGAQALESLGIVLDEVRQAVEEVIGRGEHELKPGDHVRFTPRAKKVLELSLREALQLGHNYIGTEHILLGLIREGEGVAAQVLVKLGASLAAARERVVALVGISPQGERAGSRRAGTVASASVLADILSRLDEIAARLGAIERHLGMSGGSGGAGGPERDGGA